jgi:YVTN family beta-propeller protein
VIGAAIAVLLVGGIPAAHIVSRTSPPPYAAAAEVAPSTMAPAASPSPAPANEGVERSSGTGGRGADAPSAPAGQAGVYAGITNERLNPRVRRDPVRVYVPNNHSNSVDVIDPRTYRVVRRIAVGDGPQHVTPSWNMRYLYVGDTYGNALTVLDPRHSRVVRTIRIPDPYNLYFTPDGSAAIDVAERLSTLFFYDPTTWKLLGSVRIPWSGPDHLDFSADGRYLLISTEFDGHVVKVDTRRMRVVGSLAVGGLPVDVKLSPDGSSFYVANQGRSGVSVIDPRRMRETDFIHTGAGAHGMCVSRDARFLYVSNRLAGTISVLRFASNRVVHTWNVGGSPDMLQVSADGRELWASNRYDATVSVIRTRTGTVIHTIPVGDSPHGLTLFPQPGRYSLGHNGVYR